MVAVMMVMALTLSLAAALHSSLLADTGLRGAHQATTSGFYAAEAGVNRGMGDYRNIFMTQNVPTGSDFDVHTFSLGPRRVSYQLTVVPGWENGQQVTVPAGRQYAGLSATEYRYTTSARSQLRSGDTEVTLGTEFDVDYIPLFQYLAFYQGDLEIMPGPVMNLHGPIHTNGNLYLNANATLTIADCTVPTCPAKIPTVHLSTAGDVYRGRKDNTTCTGTVQVARLTDQNKDGLLDLQAMACGTTSQKQTAAQLSGWLGAITSRIPKVSVPTPDDFVYASGKNWGQADLRIVLDLKHPDANGRYAIFVEDDGADLDEDKTERLQEFMIAKPGAIFYNDVPKAGKDNATACTAGDSYCNAASYAPAFTGAVYQCAYSDLGRPPQAGCANGYIANEALGDGTMLDNGSVTARRGGFYNNREHAWVRMLNVNVHDLLAWNRLQPPSHQLFDPDDTSDGGPVVYLAVVGPATGAIPATNPATRYGVRVFGSSDLDFPSNMANPTGLTVVSDQGIYVEGTYNAGTAAHPKMPAAFMGDTINVLSSAWSGTASTKNDYQSRQGLGSGLRNGGNTTVYAAFVGGVDVTTTGNYNGGFENYPRFQEDWSTPGATLFYRGSFASLGPPRHNNGAWCNTGTTCNIYDPPVRDWDFDTDFQSVANLPPLTPNSVSVEQILFTQSFR